MCARIIRAAAVNESCSVYFAGSSVLSDWQKISAQTLPLHQEHTVHKYVLSMTIAVSV